MSEIEGDPHAQVGADPLDSGPGAASLGDVGRGADDIERALAEYDDATSRPPAPPEPATAQEWRVKGALEGFSPAEIEQLLPKDLKDAEQLFKASDALLDNYKLGREVLSEFANRLSVERDRQDAFRLIDTLRQRLPDLARMSDTTVHALLAGLYETDARTRDAWEGRYQAGGPARWADQLNRITNRLYADLSSRIDQDATETKLVVSAAVRGGGRPAPPAPMVDLNKLNDAELAKYTKENFGF